MQDVNNHGNIIEPKVSVIINCHNGEEFLSKTLENLANQTFQNFEVIFWDNCSNDGTEKIAKAFDERLKYFKGNEFVSLGKARNLAINKASGKYIAFLDADDLWSKDKLELQVSVLESKKDIGMVCSGFYRLNMFTGVCTEAKIFTETRELDFSCFVQKYGFSLSSFLIRKAALDGLDHLFHESLKYAEEYELFIRIALNWKVYYLEQCLATYRIHAGMNSIKLQGQIPKEYDICIKSLESLRPSIRKEYPEVIRAIEYSRDFWKAKYLTSIGKNYEVRSLLKPYLFYNYRAFLFYCNALLPSSISQFIFHSIYSKKGF